MLTPLRDRCSAGEEIRRQRRPAITKSRDIRFINKQTRAACCGASLEVMDRDCKNGCAVDLAYLFAEMKHDKGVGSAAAT